MLLVSEDLDELLELADRLVVMFHGQIVYETRASDADLRQAIIEAVKFYDDYEKHFKWDGDFWDCVARAVALAQRDHPQYLDTTYRDARNHLAYLMK